VTKMLSPADPASAGYSAPLDLLPVELTSAERSALSGLVAPHLSREQPLPESPAPLAQLRRLLEPLTRAGEALSLDSQAARAVERAILHAMQATGRAYAVWDLQTWASTARSAGPRAAAVLAVACHLGCLSPAEALTLGVQPTAFARRLFGRAALDREVGRVLGYLQGIGYSRSSLSSKTPSGALTRLLLLAGRPKLEALTVELLEAAYGQASASSKLHGAYPRLRRALRGMDLLPRAGPMPEGPCSRDALTGIDPVWTEWCVRWLNTSTLAPKSRRDIYYSVLRAGRWLARCHPEVHSPDDWTREVALAYVSAVDKLVIGDLGVPSPPHELRRGEPICARTKAHHLATLRIFFRDCQEWGWIQRRFDPGRALATPRGVRALISPNPRVIADEVWARLLWTGVKLTPDDLIVATGSGRNPVSRRVGYPFALVKALAITWLFAGLRSNELLRLRVGCIRWQRQDGGPGAAQDQKAGAACLLDVPVQKTGASYTKPVDPLVGEAIAAWEAERPTQPLQADRKTGERVAFLFCLRGRLVSSCYLNGSLIPLLCRRAGVPLRDARGAITSHRARSTIASQLYNAKEPMTLGELQAWLGHRSPLTTLNYARITPTTLTRAYTDAGYFARNIRAIEVLIDQDAIKNAAAAGGQPWRYYDLGHGLCSYEFFEQCPHRMACAKCDFYNPKESSRSQLLEAKSNLLRLLQRMPLTEDERSAADGDLSALDRLVARLVDQPTPSGQTPSQLATGPATTGARACQIAGLWGSGGVTEKACVQAPEPVR